MLQLFWNSGGINLIYLVLTKGDNLAKGYVDLQIGEVQKVTAWITCNLSSNMGNFQTVWYQIHQKVYFRKSFSTFLIIPARFLWCRDGNLPHFNLKLTSPELLLIVRQYVRYVSPVEILTKNPDLSQQLREILQLSTGCFIVRFLSHQQ